MNRINKAKTLLFTRLQDVLAEESKLASEYAALTWLWDNLNNAIDDGETSIAALIANDILIDLDALVELVGEVGDKYGN